MKKYWKKINILITIGTTIGIGLFLFLIFIKTTHISQSAPELLPVVTENIIVQNQEIKIENPIMRLQIPKISVDASIETVGLKANGEMGVPKNPNNVAWYQAGPRPGEEGSSVLSGHYDSVKGKAVFFNLSKLRRGDTLSVYDTNGKLLNFIVREIKVYDKDADASQIFFSKNGIHLNLITCGGAWDKETKSYAKRIVVFTDLVN